MRWCISIPWRAPALDPYSGSDEQAQQFSFFYYSTFSAYCQLNNRERAACWSRNGDARNGCQ